MRKVIKIKDASELKQGDLVAGILTFDDIDDDGYVYFRDDWSGCIFKPSTVNQWLRDGAKVEREVEDKPLWSGKVSEMPAEMVGTHQNKYSPGVFYHSWIKGTLYASDFPDMSHKRICNCVMDILNREVTEYRPDTVEDVETIEWDTSIDECKEGLFFLTSRKVTNSSLKHEDRVHVTVTKVKE